MRTATYNLNLRVGTGIPPIVKVSQNDEGRSIGFRLFDGALAFFPGATAEVTISGTKPSGLGFTETCTVSGSLATVETTLAMTQESGQINAELRITDGTLNVGTTNFVLYVEPAPHPAGTTDGTTEEARTVLEQCAQYAQEAHEAASDVAPQVEELVDAAVADKMEEIEDAVQSVTDAATQAVSDITAAGEAVEESIPSDYTALSAQVSQLSESLGDKADKQLNTFANENIKSSSILTGASRHTMKNFIGVTFSPTIENRTQNGVTYSQNDNVISISGTATSGFSVNNIIGATSSVPAIFKKGYAYSLWFDSTDSNIYMQVSMRKNGVEVYNIHTNISPLNFYVPSDITGLLIRFYIRQGDEVNGTVGNFALHRVFDSFLKSTGDTTDRTEEITTILQTIGVCKLESGVYYVKNLQIPEGSALYGCGKATIVRLSDDNDAVYAISTNTNTGIYNLCVEGANADITLSDTKNTQRYGIYHSAHYTSPDLTTTKRWVQIDNVSISRFAGSGLYNEDTGLPTDAGLCLSNCRIYNCNVGINIPYSGEYNKYTCVDITRCYYGFIANGSSNVFVGGSISSCYIGIYCYGDGENTPNIGHCVFSGCTFNHYYGSDGTVNAGTLLDMTACMSWTFDGCNLAYGDINITNSNGIIFNSCQIGAKADFNIDGGWLVLFTGNVSRTSTEPVITITNNNLCKFHNNYARSGVAWSQNT